MRAYVYTRVYMCVNHIRLCTGPQIRGVFLTEIGGGLVAEMACCIFSKMRPEEVMVCVSNHFQI
jgi:hypothetical protein